MPIDDVCDIRTPTKGVDWHKSTTLLSPDRPVIRFSPA